jgi:hypothetical protein
MQIVFFRIKYNDILFFASILTFYYVCLRVLFKRVITLKCNYKPVIHKKEPSIKGNITMYKFVLSKKITNLAYNVLFDDVTCEQCLMNRSLTPYQLKNLLSF